MIRLVKIQIPDILRRNETTWTQELLADGGQGKAKSSRYGHPDIKSALIAETHGKCAYCESKLLHIAYGDVEHIIAKAVAPSRAYEWANLTLACDKCNTKKSDNEDILDPYTHDPASMLSFFGPWIASTMGSDLGRVTIVVLDLNRADLMERRKEKLDALLHHIDAVLNTSNLNRRKVLLDALLDDTIHAKTEFSACLTEHIRQLRERGELPF
jgi:uncharacterized protein (TIGR02646 family)